MEDMEKFRGLTRDGYTVKSVNIDGSGKGVIKCIYSGNDNPPEGEIYFLITDDKLLIERAKEYLSDDYV